MPISKQGWEILIVRTGTQRRPSDGKVRTIGTYQVYHDGKAVPGLAGMTAEPRGPGSTTVRSRRIAQGHYPLATQSGGKYSTLHYTLNANPAALRRPAIELLGTAPRSEDPDPSRNRLPLLDRLHQPVHQPAQFGRADLLRGQPAAGDRSDRRHEGLSWERFPKEGRPAHPPRNGGDRRRALGPPPRPARLAGS